MVERERERGGTKGKGRERRGSRIEKGEGTLR
jgi:hypothetical protein